MATMARLLRFTIIAAGAWRMASAADFERDVLPVFRARCSGCHGSSTQASGLRFDQEPKHRAIVPGSSANSRLYRVITGLDPKLAMPPSGPRLTPAEIRAIQQWIDAGAKWTATARPEHWAFVAPRLPETPRTRDSAWVRGPIDSFVLSTLERRGIAPSPGADAATLVRRLHLDLTGLPPSPEDAARYLADRDPSRYERLVDELLRSPHFGEKWARHWLDLSRYSDSEGNESDFPRPYAWRYRHWLIEAFNGGMRFDEFTLRQIAGDLLPESGVEQRAGLGFFRNTSSNREGGAEIEAERVEQTVDRTNLIGLAWLGLTVGCARCHDHKYDPVSQREYFRLYSFLNNADEVNIDAPLPGERESWERRRPEYERKRAELLGPLANEIAELQRRWEEKIRWAEANPGKDHIWDRQLELLGLQWEQGFGGGQLEGMSVLYLPPAQRSRRQCDHMEEMFLGRGSVIDPERWKQLDLAGVSKKLQALLKEYPPMTQAPSMVERAHRRRDNYVHVRGGYRGRGPAVEEDVPAVLPRLPEGVKRDRLALARWLLAPENPLTARVVVNRVWQEMFGRGIVATPDDFGTQGARPSHPELLDWLAVDFRENGWDFKRLIRTIAVSNTYRQSSHYRKDLAASDPTNALLARQSRFRVSGESVRDVALAVSGLLHRETGGPSVRPPQPANVSKEGFQNEWKESEGKDRYRRGLYTHMQRTSPYAQLVTFDAPDPNLMCARRERSNSPLQALALLNDPVFFEAARALAARVEREAGPDDRARIDHAFRLCYGRPPSPREAGRARSFLARESWTLFASSLMNTDEFYTRE
jgi:cytochrome c553